MKNINTLIICTTGYPFGMAEDFLHEEVLFLAKKFKKIIVLAPVSNKPNERKDLPHNVEIIVHAHAKKNVSLLFTLSFWKLFFLEVAQSNIKLTRIQHLKIFFAFYNVGFGLKKELELIISKLNVCEVIGYSYWLNESAFALALINQDIIKISRVHGWDFMEERHAENYLPLRKFIGEKLTKFYSISEFGKKYLHQNYHYPQSKVEVSYLGTKPLNIGEFKESETFRIITCSNLIVLKNVDILIEALSLISFSVDWVHFGDGPEFESLFQKATKYLPNNISFTFKGEVDNQVIRKNYEQKTYDLFVNISSYEGVPVSIMEAMSAGVPALATQVGGTPEIVNEKSGVLVRNGLTARELSIELTNYYYLSHEEKSVKRDGAFEKWKTDFSHVINYSNFYKSIIRL